MDESSIGEQTLHAAVAPACPPGVLPCVAEDGTAAAWISCRGCGYRLFGLSAQGLCPECARPISESVRSSRVRSLHSRDLRRLRSSADSIRVGVVLAVLASAAGVIGQIVLAAFLGAAALIAACIGVISAPSIASRAAGDTMWQRIHTPGAAMLGVVAGVPICAALGITMFVSASRGGLGFGGVESFFAVSLSLLFAGSIPVLLIQPAIVWLQRVGDLFSDAGNANLLENTAAAESLLRRLQVLAFAGALLGPLFPHLLIFAGMIVVPMLLITLGILFTALLSVRYEVKRAMAEALLREADDST